MATLSSPSARGAPVPDADPALDAAAGDAAALPRQQRHCGRRARAAPAAPARPRPAPRSRRRSRPARPPSGKLPSRVHPRRPQRPLGLRPHPLEQREHPRLLRAPRPALPLSSTESSAAPELDRGGHRQRRQGHREARLVGEDAVARRAFPSTSPARCSDAPGRSPRARSRPAPQPREQQPHPAALQRLAVAAAGSAEQADHRAPVAPGAGELRAQGTERRRRASTAASRGGELTARPRRAARGSRSSASPSDSRSPVSSARVPSSGQPAPPRGRAERSGVGQRDARSRSAATVCWVPRRAPTSASTSTACPRGRTRRTRPGLRPTALRKRIGTPQALRVWSTPDGVPWKRLLHPRAPPPPPAPASGDGPRPGAAPAHTATASAAELPSPIETGSLR